jgi:hypothetical protein
VSSGDKTTLDAARIQLGLVRAQAAMSATIAHVQRLMAVPDAVDDAPPPPPSLTVEPGESSAVTADSEAAADDGSATPRAVPRDLAVDSPLAAAGAVEEKHEEEAGADAEGAETAATPSDVTEEVTAAA